MRRLLLPVLLVAAAARPARAWHSLGHRSVALIAESLLAARNPSVLRGVQALLGPGVPLDAVADCPDDIGFASAGFLCGGVFPLPPLTYEGSKPWHYIDLPVDEPAAMSQAAAHCPDRTGSGGDCVVVQIRVQQGILASPAATPRQKQWALMFLVHLVGDLHQPLHCADDRDGGGNDKQVLFMDRTKTFHALWDSLLMAEDWREQRQMDPRPLAASLLAEIAMTGTAAWEQEDLVYNAAWESHSYAAHYVYPSWYGAEHAADGSALINAPEYVAAFTPLVRERLKAAGARLALLIEQALQ